MLEIPTILDFPFVTMVSVLYIIVEKMGRQNAKIKEKDFIRMMLLRLV